MKDMNINLKDVKLHHNQNCSDEQECSPSCAIKSLDVDQYCAICFNFMVEPVQFPGTDNSSNCQHRFCLDCSKDLFREDIVTAKYTSVITRKCPYCRATGRLVKDKRYPMEAQESYLFSQLKIDQELVNEFRNKFTDEFLAEQTRLTNLREF